MLMAHPSVLRELMEQYEELRALHGRSGSAEARQRMDDLAYTLCVCTGTREVGSALDAARMRLSTIGGGPPTAAPARATESTGAVLPAS
ncbi:DUF5133 domain-containing protein [Streptomyces longisporoflavus]|uniref:DUF5133 domain-containing protein n=1 Tax=Streptomyces longisporoflavus TaxID=28044 RepID=UPI00167E3DB2|nr:DUF5133 domain-containing protein [Streptomyces longisporoflavus]GGV27021.1 DUF5133 domain-containing protein [Streptomyces longisporoflavus]